MNTSNADIRRQLRLGEDSRWEFKQIEFAGNRPKSPKRDELADEIAAFANSNGGFLLCGVTDAGTVQGMSRKQMDELERLLVEICTDTIKPSFRPSIFRRELDYNKPFLLVEVPPGDNLYDSPGGNFTRVGSTKRLLTSDERLRLSQRRAQARYMWFDKQHVPETGFQTLVADLWKPLLSVEGASTPQTALKQLGLLVLDEFEQVRATVAGILLCTHNPEHWLPQAVIRATFYSQSHPSSGQLDAQEITGPLDRQITRAVAFVKRNMMVAARKTPARVDMPQYSIQAIFEAIVNAVVHRDYSIHASAIRLSMFKDRLEIRSPGELPNGMTIDAMPVSQATRNETLASNLGHMKVFGVAGSEDRRYFMERRGDGVRIIQRTTRELCGKDPDYSVIDRRELSLIIPAASHRNNPDSVTVKVLAKGQPCPDVSLLILYPNKTWMEAATEYDGAGRVELYTTELPMKVFVARSGYRAHCEEGWIPKEGPLIVNLKELPSGGAVIFPNKSGYIPGLKGRLNPKRDTLDRTYLYTTNVAINEGRQQPVSFLYGEELRLTDNVGYECMIRIIDITGQSALLEYRDLSK